LGSATTDRFYYHWWEIGTDVFVILMPILQISAFATQSLYGRHSNLVYIIGVAIILVLELLKVVKRSFDWARCDEYQFCRNFDPAGDPSSPNFVFYLLYFFTVFYFFVAVVYMLLIATTVRRDKIPSAKQQQKGN